MSEVLTLASLLRDSSDEFLLNLTRQRGLITSNLRDFFDLADALLSTRNLQSAISSLSAAELSALKAFGSAEAAASNAATANPASSNAEPAVIDERVKDALLEKCLIMKQADGYRAFEAVSQVVQQLLAEKQNKQTHLANRGVFKVAQEPVAARSAKDQSVVDREAAVTAFETLQALTEIVFYFDAHLVRVVGKGGVGLPDLKKLSSRINKTTDQVRELCDLAMLIGLIRFSEKRWELGSISSLWLDWNQTERWHSAVAAWLLALGPHKQREIHSALSVSDSMALSLTTLYPLADNNLAAHIKRLANASDLLGVTDNQLKTSWTLDTVNDQVDQAAMRLAKLLPATTDRLIVQADLSIITTGPLPTRTEMTLRGFAECEQIGFASTYRLSPASLSLALERGQTIDAIRDLLTQLSGRDLPQPVEYLLRETSERFGRLVVEASTEPNQSILTSADEILLREILNSPQLKPFGLVQSLSGDIACRFEPEILYFGLREVGYIAILEPKLRQEIDSTRAQNASSTLLAGVDDSTGTQSGDTRSDIKRWRQSDEKVGNAPDDEDITRQIQLAMKNKAKLLIRVRTSSGAEQEFLLEPMALANGRLRAKDRKADIERTLPLTSIIAVSIA